MIDGEVDGLSEGAIVSEGEEGKVVADGAGQ